MLIDRTPALDSLQAKCVRFIADNIDILAPAHAQNNAGPIPSLMAETLIKTIANDDFGISQEHITLFTRDFCSLVELEIYGFKLKSTEAMKFLQHHNFQRLSMTDVKSIEFNEWFKFVKSENLEYLNISGCLFRLRSPKLTFRLQSNRSFGRLRVLNVSKTNFCDEELDFISRYATGLENLNLSGARITELKPLQLLEKLKIIKLAFLRGKREPIWSILSDIKQLEIVDVGRSKTPNRKPLRAITRMIASCFWPRLISLDLYNCGEVDPLHILYV